MTAFYCMISAHDWGVRATDAGLSWDPSHQNTDENSSNTKVLFIVRSDFFYFIFVRPNGRTYICAALQGYQTIRVGSGYITNY